MTKQKEEEEHEDRVREWEEGLPSLADLISLSQCLISPQLASAFSITSPSPSPSPAPARSPADVTLASHTTFSSLCCASQTYPDLLGKVNPHPQPHSGVRALCGVEDPQLNAAPCGVEEPQLNAGDDILHGVEASHVNPHPQLRAGDCAPRVMHVSERIYNGNLKSVDGIHSYEIHLADFTPLEAKERSHGGGVSVREWHDNSQLANAGHLRSYGGDASVGKYYGSSAPLDGYGGGDLKASERGGDGDDEGEGEAHMHANAGPCISDSSDVATRADIDNEAEEADSTPSNAENPNAETAARTLKRPRLVWTPELHKRFVDAVSHLGVKTAVPKTIMQLMNVEGLTRENVASHLQKYRLYLKRIQGLSNEGPTSSDHLFATTPVPAGLAMPGRFHTGMPVHLQDINQVPFAPSHNPVSMGRGHVAGIVSGPLPSMDPFSFNIFARPPTHRFVQGDVQDMQGFRQHQSASSQHVQKK